MSRINRIHSLVIFGVLSGMGCLRGVDTVVIKTVPPGADLFINGEYVGVVPKTVRSPYIVNFVPHFYARYIIRDPINVVIEKDGYKKLTTRIYLTHLSLFPSVHIHVDGSECFCPRIQVLGPSKFGWGKTYEYTFRLREDLIDFREACRLLNVSPMTAFPWVKEGQFPTPVRPPRDDRSAYGALWRRGDIEAWNEERQLHREDTDE